jgi:hypothetical protein
METSPFSRKNDETIGTGYAIRLITGTKLNFDLEKCMNFCGFVIDIFIEKIVAWNSSTKWNRKRQVQYALTIYS